MPYIEVTPEQYADYQAGGSIQKPNEIKHFIVVRADGGVIEYTTLDGRPQAWTALRKSKTVSECNSINLSYDFTQNKFDTVIEFDPNAKIY